LQTWISGYNRLQIAMQNSYLISYGTCSFLGRFVLRDGEASFQRGDRVVVQSERGREIGTVLTRTDELALPVSLRHIPGEIISRAELVDEIRAQGLAEKSAVAFAQARSLIHDLALPLEIIDVEVITEPEVYAIHFVRYGEAASQFVQDTLTELYKKPVLLHDLTDPGTAVVAVLKAVAPMEPVVRAAAQVRSFRSSGKPISPLFVNRWKRRQIGRGQLSSSAGSSDGTSFGELNPNFQFVFQTVG
jgi:hypothetical protein